jgi:preprotein translocase subunit SecG
MNLHTIDLVIIAIYVVVIVAVGFLFTKMASKNVALFFGGQSHSLVSAGISNSSSMYDITGTMWLVYLLFAYGLKSAMIPWIWADV